jgi:putative transposase
MARLPRLIVPHQPHVIQTGATTSCLPRYRGLPTFLGWLRSAAKNYKVAIHAMF